MTTATRPTNTETQIIITANTGGKNSIAEPMYSVELLQHGVPGSTGHMSSLGTGMGESKSVKVVRALVARLQAEHSVAAENVIQRL